MGSALPSTLVAIAFVASIAGVACTDIDHHEVTPLAVPPLVFDVSDEEIEITEGTAVVVRIAVLDSGAYLIPPEEIEWSVEGGDAASITATDLPGIYAVAGVRTGVATLVASSVAHGSESRLRVTVTPQD